MGDDHHSPATAKEYLVLRVRPQIRFYQKRLPLYSTARAVIEMVLVAASLCGMVLAFLSLSSWAAISVAVATAATAYSKFLDPEKKLRRFSDTIAAIDSILLWWASLTDVEQATQVNINDLVARCEDLFQSERQAWVSTAMANTLLAEA